MCDWLAKDLADGQAIKLFCDEWINVMNELRISRDTQLEPKVYVLPEGITIESDNVTLDGNGATIMGTRKTASQGINVTDRKNIVIKNIRVLNYYHGVSVKQSTGIEIHHCNVTLTTEIQSNTMFLDIWKPAGDAYGGAIFLEQVTH